MKVSLVTTAGWFHRTGRASLDQPQPGAQRCARYRSWGWIRLHEVAIVIAKDRTQGVLVCRGGEVLRQFGVLPMGSHGFEGRCQGLFTAQSPLLMTWVMTISLHPTMVCVPEIAPAGHGHKQAR